MTTIPMLDNHLKNPAPSQSFILLTWKSKTNLGCRM